MLSGSALISILLLWWAWACCEGKKKDDASQEKVWDIGEKGRVGGEPYGLLTKQQTECEVESLAVGSLLADNYNSLDEGTEWDARIHSDYLSEHLGFFAMIRTGTWGSNGKTTFTHKDASELQRKGGWIGNKKMSKSAYWALEDQWIYVMGDSTARQVWATFASPQSGNEFERNSKEWTRERCRRQYPHRKKHPEGNHPDEGWSGKCGNNEVTCHLSGYGKKGKLTYDWKHFPYEDYDQWLFGNEGMWGNNRTTSTQNLEGHAVELEFKEEEDGGKFGGKEAHQERVDEQETTKGNKSEDNSTFRFPKRRPDVFVNQMALHVCFHAWNNDHKTLNETFVSYHEKMLPVAMQAMKEAISRPLPEGTPIPKEKQTKVIIMTSGRVGSPDIALDLCIWKFNQRLTIEAHKVGFPVYDREEVERRLLRRSEGYLGWPYNGRYIKPNMHLAVPGPQIVATGLLSMISCLRRNEKLEALKTVASDRPEKS